MGLVATIGYVAFLVGPPGLGALGDHVGLRPALLVVLACAACAAFLAPAVDTRDRDTRDRGTGPACTREDAAEAAGR